MWAKDAFYVGTRWEPHVDIQEHWEPVAPGALPKMKPYVIEIDLLWRLIRNGA